MCSRIPNKGEQMVGDHGYDSNVSRGKRKEAGADDAVPCLPESQGNEKAFRRNRARLIQKIYDVDPLICPKCQGAMRVISSIEDPSAIRAILERLWLWLARARPPPKIHDPPVCILGAGRSAAPSIADGVSQIPVYDDHVYGDPQFSWNDDIQA